MHVGEHFYTLEEHFTLVYIDSMWLLRIQCVFNYLDFPKPCLARDITSFDETAVP